MTPEREVSRSGELTLNMQQEAFVQDTSKGYSFVYVGPHAATVNEQPVRWDGRRFISCKMEESIQDFSYIDEQSYAVLTNPAKGGHLKRPDASTKSIAIELNYGRKIVVPGPAHFPLWPGETIRIIEGHVLRSNQYLVALVTNGDEATTNWGKAVLKPQTTTQPPPSTAPGSEDNKADDKTSGGAGGENAAIQPPQTIVPKLLVTGQRIIIRGTEYSFFIPPTGVEVVPDERNNKFVRDAVTLESLQYCVLLSEGGKKRYVYGPDVVFPEPSETFVTEGDERVFRAIELNPQMGIHVKVIADYEEGGQTYKAGQELFITGARQQIYFPRAEHAIVPYRGNEQVHFAVVVPEGEARYVLNKITGRVETFGSQMLLCDPITHVIVRRILTEKEVSLWFPGNSDAQAYNTELRRIEAEAKAVGAEPYLSERAAVERLGSASGTAFAAARGAEARFVGERLERRTGFTPPKSITLKTKFDGAVSINVWPGYAMQIVSKSGDRQVVVGPDNKLLGYDQTLAVFELSAGVPKGSKTEKVRDVYLRIVGNKVSDEVSVETGDMVNVKVRLSYRVNFEGSPDRWFALEDYVGFMVDHLRSVIRGAVKRHGIEEFNQNAVNILRDTVLGTAVDGGRRPGKLFEENGMRVYDLEVLDVTIGDQNIANMLATAQKEAVQQALKLQQRRRDLEVTQEVEEINRQIADTQTTTTIAKLGNAIAETEKRLSVELAQDGIVFSKARAKLDAEQATQQLVDELHAKELARKKDIAEATHDIEKAKQVLALALIDAETQATVERFKAIQPDLIKALEAFGSRDLVTKVATALRTIPMGVDEGMGKVMDRIFKGTVLESVVSQMNNQDGNAQMRAAQ